MVLGNAVTIANCIFFGLGIVFLDKAMFVAIFTSSSGGD